ncbi:unnamed protein product [Bursaphelenchus xylophilus]|uniref:(pine wood nematode) hypothetical protein n=1 Tax=Bursaphelenchus xylophilus TaxID=6326 RepID=A0A811K7C9_BURXY|nr:unnamed protein product [Bursaphelenchus xylophilus]CAG9087358.1 unnamed protein product [Bursaphelenchus xylophilus]
MNPRISESLERISRPYFQCPNSGPGRHLHGRDPNQRLRQHGIFPYRLPPICINKPISRISESLERISRPYFQCPNSGPGRHLHGRDLNQRFRQHGINPALESVNLWNAFPDPTFNVPIPAQDGTYMAETLTNDLHNMEYFPPRFHCRIHNVYHPFFTTNLKLEKKVDIAFTYATFPVPFATLILPSHSHRTPPPFHSHHTPPPSHSLFRIIRFLEPWRSWRNQWCPGGLHRGKGRKKYVQYGLMVEEQARVKVENKLFAEPWKRSIP